MGNSLSIVIPARNEPYLNQTLRSLNPGDLETIVVLDGLTQSPLDFPYPVTVIQNETPHGLTACLNQAITASHGEYILRVDAHCIFEENFIDILMESVQPDRVTVARRFTLDLNTMKPVPRAVDYYYLSCPWTHPTHFMMQSCPWIGRTEAMQDVLMDDLMCFQGSMWMMSRSHWDWMGGVTDRVEHHEISMKTWLGGRRVVIDKRAWYAHPSKRVGSYRLDQETLNGFMVRSTRRWTAEPGFAGLIEKFWPLPAEKRHHRLEKYTWPVDWRKYLD